MGWLWSSSSTPSGESTKADTAAHETEPAKRQGFGLSEEQRLRIFGKPGNLQDADKSRDAQADKELEVFLNSFATSESSTEHGSSHGVPKPALKPQAEERSDHDRILPDGSLDISPAAMYPRTMSCRQAFDQAYYCQSLGGKFNDIYRYGAMQSCSEQWGAFWFCMRTRTQPQKEREIQIKDYYAARDERRRKEFGSSESVWEIRHKAVQTAFDKDPDADEEGGVDLKE